MMKCVNLFLAICVEKIVYETLADYAKYSNAFEFDGEITMINLFND